MVGQDGELTLNAVFLVTEDYVTIRLQLMAATSCVQGYQPKVNPVTRIHVLIIIMQNFRFQCSTDKTSILQIFYLKNGAVHITKCLLISVDGGWSRWHTHRHHRCSVTCGGVYIHGTGIVTTHTLLMAARSATDRLPRL